MKSAVKIWRERQARYQCWGKSGKIVSFTKIMEPPHGFGRRWYWVVLVELRRGKRVIGQLTGKKEPEIGGRVVGVVRRLRQARENEVIEYGVKFELI